MAKRVDIPVKDIEKEFNELKDFLEDEYPSRETYGKRWVGRKAFKIASKQVQDWKNESKDVQKSWKDLKKEIETTLRED